MREPKVEPATEALIRQEIERAGPMRFDRFVDIALYHPVHGYYGRGGPVRGRSGDYFTSMQVSNLFPRIFAEVLKGMRWYVRMGRRVWLRELFEFFFAGGRTRNGPSVEEFWGASLSQQEYALAKPQRRRIPIHTLTPSA